MKIDPKMYLNAGGLTAFTANECCFQCGGSGECLVLKGDSGESDFVGCGYCKGGGRYRHYVRVEDEAKARAAMSAAIAAIERDEHETNPGVGS